jgi:hypothetical protein
VLKSLDICCGCCKEYGLGKAQSMNFRPMGILHNVIRRKVLKICVKFPMKMKVRRMTLCMGIQLWVKHSEKICNLCGGYLISMNFLSRNWEGYYAYSSRVGGNLCLLISVRPSHYWGVGIRTLPFTCLVICIGLVHD